MQKWLILWVHSRSPPRRSSFLSIIWIYLPSLVLLARSLPIYGKGVSIFHFLSGGSSARKCHLCSISKHVDQLGLSCLFECGISQTCRFPPYIPPSKIFYNQDSFQAEPLLPLWLPISYSISYWILTRFTTRIMSSISCDNWMHAYSSITVVLSTLR